MKAFWTTLPSDARGQRDPLAIRSILEATADILVPGLTGRTTSADDYLRTLTGLRWAASRAKSDVETWQRFELFEKALKVSWVHCGTRTGGFSGLRAVQRHLDAGRRGLDFELLANQRAQGLLGSYLTSLRAAGLVEGGSFTLTSRAQRMIRGIDFDWSGEAQHYGWMALRFDRLHFTSSERHQLGLALFNREELRAVAQTIRRLGERCRWQTATRRLSRDQRILAAVGAALGRVANSATAAFWHLVHELPGRSPKIDVTGLGGTSWRDLVFHGALAGYRDAWDEFIAGADNPRRALLRLHAAVWRQRGHDGLWIDEKGRARSDIAARPPRDEDFEPDLRWGVCWKLMRQCRWTG